MSLPLPRHSLAAAGLLLSSLLGCSAEVDAPGGAALPPLALAPGEGPARWVQPLIGTADTDAPRAILNGKGGATYPGAAAPFGMVQWSPDTPKGIPNGYAWKDERISGFSLTHLNGAGCPGRRDFPVMPVVGRWDGAAALEDAFSHDEEVAWPGYYHVQLGSGVRVDLTATQRAGLARFSFPPGREGTLVLSDALDNARLFARDFEATVRADGVVLGSRENILFCASHTAHRAYFALRFQQAPRELGTWREGALQPNGPQVRGERVGVYARFGAEQARSVQVKVGLSYVSAEGALANLDAELPGWDFEAVRAGTFQRWNELLGRLTVEGGTEAQRTVFTTALYHSLLQPAVATDVSGDYLGFDGAVHRAQGYTRYQDFSGWDIYRSWIQLASLVAPTETGDMMRSLVESGQECGVMPRWSLSNNETGAMVGDPASALVASAYAFGVRGFDAGAALQLARRSAEDPTAACHDMRSRPGLADYLTRGYCPKDGAGAPLGPPSTTLEYALADFSIAKLAEALGDSATHAEYLRRSAYWRRVFDPGLSGNGFTGYVAPRYLEDEADGTPRFDHSIDVGRREGFVEGNAAQYTFMVPHDVPGLIDALGGDSAFIARLDALFTELNAGPERPYAYMGNEPNFFTPWEYPWAGAPARTQAVVQRILAELFTAGPGGLPGNDDLGATSSWAVLAMLGLYPVAPGVGGFIVGSPTFSKLTLAVPERPPLVITASRTAPGDLYVQSLTLDGAPHPKAWLDWSRLERGASLHFELGPSPSPSFGVAPEARPPAWLAPGGSAP